MPEQQTIIFRGATLKHFDGRQSQDGSDFHTRLYFATEFSDTVRESMEWEDPGDTIRSAKLTGELCAHNLILTPGDKRLRDAELQIGVKDVTDFQVVALKDDDGEPAGRQLRFTVRTPQDGASALAEQYIRRVGRHEGQLRISYSPQAVQEDLPGAKVAQPAAADENKQEPIEQHLTGAALEAHQSRTGTLPSAREMQAKVREMAGRAPKVQ